MTLTPIGEEERSDPKDYLYPAMLLAAGVLAYLVHAFVKSGMGGVGGMLLYLPIQIIVQVIVGVVACLLTVRIMGTTFGYLTSAIVKLAAIFVFPTSVTAFIPYVGGLIALIIYWGLLEWLFELDPMETIVLSLVIWGLNAGVILLLATVHLAMMG